jgi:hypothetical protein
MALVRVAVFIDWMNVYKQARKAFGLEGEPGVRGQISPLSVANVLTAGNKRRSDGQLVRVEVHRGQPLPNSDEVGHTAVTLHSQSWRFENPKLVVPQLRPLRQEIGEQAREKGVDVALAVHAMEYAVLGRADVVIIFSHDTDLLPVVEAIQRIKGDRYVETASWRTDDYKKRIPPRGRVVNHSLRGELFEMVEDKTNYGAQARTRLARRRP